MADEWTNDEIVALSHGRVTGMQWNQIKNDNFTAPWLLNRTAVECRNKFWREGIRLNGLDVEAFDAFLANMENDDVEDEHLLEMWSFNQQPIVQQQQPPVQPPDVDLQAQLIQNLRNLVQAQSVMIEQLSQVVAQLENISRIA
ncbi:hypothetical protein TSUD_49650 [Trifolium subterraneum]|uniref:Myb-like domain-containing protein n=1 Tax=Trifolium subterraneum TaxID=3900 RepID=A0A2Z6NFJ7_TRISU|nr:hypothetical protein TSUD_49650 [Trifolium subterraneum]